MSPASLILLNSVIAIISGSGGAFLIDYLYTSKQKEKKTRYIKHIGFCDRVDKLLQECISEGTAFWLKPRSPAMDSSYFLVMRKQTRLESAYPFLKGIGFEKFDNRNEEAITQFLMLLTGGDFDDANRPARPEIVTQLSEHYGILLKNIDLFKESL